MNWNVNKFLERVGSIFSVDWRLSLFSCSLSQGIIHPTKWPFNLTCKGKVKVASKELIKFPCISLLYQVKQLCGSPTMVAAVKSDDDYHHQVNHPTATLKTVDDIIPMDNEMIQFLVSIENSQDFYSNIVNR